MNNDNDNDNNNMSETLEVKPVRKDNNFDNLTIKNGRIYGLTMSYHFQVKLSESENPGICPKVNCDGMPVEVLMKKAWEAMKVSGRPSMKKLSKDDLIKAYHNQEINWSVMVSQEAANNWLGTASMDDNQLDREIERLQALRNK